MLKRCIDISMSAAILFLACPIFLIVTIAVWFESGRPIIFRQKRVGKNFVSFDILKFRTMRSGPSGSLLTVRGDARITTVGRFLRATKIDEIPQFWNVMRGDMSVVGPRPEVLDYVELFRDRYRNILTIRPGITDLASIRFRNEEAILAKSQNPLEIYKSFILPAKLDLADQYLRERGLFRDIEIIFKTAIITLRPPASALPPVTCNHTDP